MGGSESKMAVASPSVTIPQDGKLSTFTSSTTSTTSDKPKPCCVCLPQKSTRDECMLLSTSSDPERGECKSKVEEYRECMRGFGFSVP